MKYNDDELVPLIYENSEEAEQIIIDKYRYLINNHIKNYENTLPKLGLDRNDIYQEGLIGLMQAIKNFKKEKDVLFYTYACVCIDTSIKNAIRKANRLKFKNLNESLSLDSMIVDDKITMYNFLEDENSDPDKKLLDKETEEEIISKLKEYLTEFEIQVFNLRISGLKNDEIAKVLDKEKRSIENAINRIKIKYKKAINKK